MDHTRTDTMTELPPGITADTFRVEGLSGAYATLAAALSAQRLHEQLAELVAFMTGGGPSSRTYLQAVEEVSARILHNPDGLLRIIHPNLGDPVDWMPSDDLPEGVERVVHYRHKGGDGYAYPTPEGAAAAMEAQDLERRQTALADLLADAINEDGDCGDVVWMASYLIAHADKVAPLLRSTPTRKQPETPPPILSADQVDPTAWLVVLEHDGRVGIWTPGSVDHRVPHWVPAARAPISSIPRTLEELQERGSVRVAWRTP